MKGWYLSILLLILTVGASAIGAEYRSTESTQVIQVSRAERVCNNNSNCKYMVFSDQGTFENRIASYFGSGIVATFTAKLKMGKPIMQQPLGGGFLSFQCIKTLLGCQKLMQNKLLAIEFGPAQHRCSK